MSKLNEGSRKLLHVLIHGGDDWWSVVGDTEERCAALDALLEHRLIEVDRARQATRATERGVRSNQKLLATGWKP